MSDELLTLHSSEPELEVRSESERIIGVRVVKWDELGYTAEGAETFVPGAFAGIDPTEVVLRMEHEGPPAGRGVTLEERDDGAHMTFHVAPTARGDELLQLAKGRYVRGVSPSFLPMPGGTDYETRGRERVTVRRKVNLREVSTTWRPTYQGAEIMYTRAKDVTTEQPETNGAAVDTPDIGALIGSGFDKLQGTFDTRLAEIEERFRQERLEQRSTDNVHLPAPEAKVPVYRGDWMRGAVELMDGGTLQPFEERALADLITTGNVGLVPPAYSRELIGIIDKRRPFLASTKKIDLPDSGMQIIFPRIVTRPTVDEQTVQKTEVTSTPVTTDTITEPVRSYFGAGDISIQLLRRSSPSFLDFYMDLLGEAYARATEAAAVTRLLAAGTVAGGTLDPAAPNLGAALTNAITAVRRPPTHMWLSTPAIAAMVGAKRTGSNEALYPDAMSWATGNEQGPSASQSGLRPVWVPALDPTAVDVMIGPNDGFAWAEDAELTLQADVPGRVGRDVALGGFIAFLPLYPAAFTTYALPI